MRKFILILAAAILLASAGPADPQKAIPPRLRNVLERAVTNEREAVIRYQAFASKADEEGYHGAAALFRACARAEGVHAARFTRALESRGIPLPEPPASQPAVGSTAENLRTASGLETGERDGIYRDAVMEAREAKDDQLALIFDQTRDTEIEHANMLGASVRQLDKLKDGKTFYVCDRCGYTSELDLPFCVLCRDGKHPHAVE